MFAFTNSKEKASPTIIGAGAKVTGEVRANHIIQIHGVVQGDVVAAVVIIGKGGHVSGSVNACEFFLHGSIDGPVTADTANIFPEAAMTGTLSYLKLNITNNDGLECKLVKRKCNAAKGK
jgi:cytoskeletal protein CcmA (bactofilin family)